MEELRRKPPLSTSVGNKGNKAGTADAKEVL